MAQIVTATDGTRVLIADDGTAVIISASEVPTASPAAPRVGSPFAAAGVIGVPGATNDPASAFPTANMQQAYRDGVADGGKAHTYVRQAARLERIPLWTCDVDQTLTDGRVIAAHGYFRVGKAGEPCHGTHCTGKVRAA